MLLAAVLLVWGILGYRIFTSFSPKDTSQQELAETTQFKPQELQEASSFTINTNYRDPFLGTLVQKKTKTRKKRIVVKKSNIPFPKIIYKGLVSSKGKKKEVFLITIDGQQYFFKKNTVLQGVKLLRGNRKEIVVKFEGQQQSFTIEK